MKKRLLFILSLALILSASAQEFSGQWKGIFTDKSSPYGGQCEYVLDLECNGTIVKGSSYTYSSEAGKNYYSICTVEGFIDKKQKYIEVRETERTKTNWPKNIGNCLQVHKLTLFKNGDSSTLKGDWVPAPKQGDCGYGKTILSRRELKQSFPNLTSKAKTNNNVTEKEVEPGKTAAKKPDPKATAVTTKKTTPAPKAAPKTNTSIANNSPQKKSAPSQKSATTAKAKTNAPVQKSQEVSTVKNEIVKKETPVQIPTDKSPVKEKAATDSMLVSKIKFEKRSNTVLQTIQVKNKTVRVDLYDNGEVDGDSISVFYNGNLLMSSKRLSEKPITLNITVEDGIINELVMYAQNLGTIAPNTALMVVTDGDKRYEVRITSDLQKSGVINFVH